MFVKADNRSYQQELAQEASLSESKNQTQEIRMQDQLSIGVTAAALSQIHPETKGKRKHSVGSSIATNGSVRSDMAEVDLTFDDRETSQGDDVPEPLHQEHAASNVFSSQPSFEPSGMPDPAPKYETLEDGPPEHGEERGEMRRGSDDQGDGHGSDINTASISKIPEMSERRGGVNPFLARPRNGAQIPDDLMDLDAKSGLMDDG
jgi:hypothetical protein